MKHRFAVSKPLSVGGDQPGSVIARFVVFVVVLLTTVGCSPYHAAAERACENQVACFPASGSVESCSTERKNEIDRLQSAGVCGEILDAQMSFNNCVAEASCSDLEGLLPAGCSEEGRNLIGLAFTAPDACREPTSSEPAELLWEMRAIEYFRSQSIEGASLFGDPIEADEGMSFIAVKMSLKNIASQLECLSPWDVELVNNQSGNRYGSRDLNSWEHRLDLCLEADQATEGYVVFHVPSDFRFDSVTLSIEELDAQPVRQDITDLPEGREP